MDDLTKGLILRLETILKGSLSKDEIKVELSEIEKESRSYVTSSMISDLYAYFEFPYFDDCCARVPSHPYSQSSKEEIKVAILQNMDLALSAQNFTPVFKVETQYVKIDDQKIRVQRIFSVDYTVEVFKSLDANQRYFATYIYGSTSIYEKTTELKIDPHIFENEDKSLVLKEVLKHRP